MSDRPLRVLALVGYPLDTAPSQRYRIEQWEPYLRALGVHVELLPFATPDLASVLYAPGRYGAKALGMVQATIRRLGHVRSARDFDVVYVLREACLVGPAWAERMARGRNPALVYDFDDAVYLSYVSPTNRYLSYLKFPGKTAALCRMAHAVMAGNAHLASYARRFNAEVSIVPSTVSLRSYRARPERKPGPPVIGWTGSHSSVQYLRLVAPALRRLRRHREFRFLAIGVSHVPFDGLDVECRPWTSAREVLDLWELDIGIMPLPDEPWAQGKCAMKAIQYMGVGIPAVVSPVGVNRDVVDHGVSGLLASDEDAWVDGLERLLSDEALRARMGAVARKTVEERFSAESQTPIVAAVFRRAVAGRRPGGYPDP